MFLAYQSLFLGDAHEIGPVRDKIAGAFNMFGLLPQASGFDNEFAFGGKTTLLYNQMVRDPNYAVSMVFMATGKTVPENADAAFWSSLINQMIPIDSDLKTAVANLAETKLCTLDPETARRYTDKCIVAYPNEPNSAAAGAAAASAGEAAATAAPVAAAPQVSQAAAPVRRIDSGCERGSSSSRTIGQSQVICGCDYAYSAESPDGNDVCAGGLYGYSVESRNGNDVACGGLYGYSAQSRDGNAVCAGGQYGYSVESRNGNDVACGGRYGYSAESRDGNDVCAGGLYGYSVQSRNGNAVACGGQYPYTATSRDGSMKCYGGRY